jgi:hypothetical protein
MIKEDHIQMQRAGVKLIKAVGSYSVMDKKKSEEVKDKPD